MLFVGPSTVAKRARNLSNARNAFKYMGGSSKASTPLPFGTQLHKFNLYSCARKLPCSKRWPTKQRQRQLHHCCAGNAFGEPYSFRGRDKLTFGKDGSGVNAVVLHHPSISKQHAVIQFRRAKGEVAPWLMDLESVNQTFLWSPEKVRNSVCAVIIITDLFHVHVRHGVRSASRTSLLCSRELAVPSQALLCAD
jgi:hypothetical protein